jgi:hypothetical protein
MRAAARNTVLLSTVLSAALLASDIAKPNAPSEIRPPKGQSLLLHLNGKGDQIYTCQSTAGVFGWKLKAPDAQLFAESGEVAGKHFAGPTWQASDGSLVSGKMVASVASPEADSIPWLLIKVTSRSGAGVLTAVQSIQRLDTQGGKAPGTGCDAQHLNAETAVPYQASYYFYGAR